MSLALTSPAFVPLESFARGPSKPEPGPSTMPARFAMADVPGGHNVSVPYTWASGPQGTRSFVLTLVDTAPVAHQWVHWMVVDIPANATALPEGVSGTPRMPRGALELQNTFGFVGYGGPQPPIGTGAHPYVATLYALDVDHLAVSDRITLEQLQRAIAGHVLASATCTGLLGR